MKISFTLKILLELNDAELLDVVDGAYLNHFLCFESKNPEFFYSERRGFWYK